MTLIIAHRGFCSRQPEATRAAYLEAIAWARSERVELGLECDVQFSADDELICLHDLNLNRTSDASGPAYERSLAELRTLNFAAGRLEDPTSDQRALITLRELLCMVAAARADGVAVSTVIETKHPNPRGFEVEQRVADLLHTYGWDEAGAPVRLVSFDVDAMGEFGRLLPGLDRTFILQHTFGRWADGELPAGVRAVAPELRLLKERPEYLEEARSRGHEIHAWTANEPADIAWCLDHDVASITSNYPDRVLAEVRARG
jgi:glycerophosphoryl diester phosphodiesterase